MKGRCLGQFVNLIKQCKLMIAFLIQRLKVKKKIFTTIIILV